MVPSLLIAERGFNLFFVNPGSANVRIGLAQHNILFNVPRCIARYTNQPPKLNVQNQIDSFLKMPFLDEEVANNSFPRKIGWVDGFNPLNGQKDEAFTWADAYEQEKTPFASDQLVEEFGESLENDESTDAKEHNASEQ